MTNTVYLVSTTNELQEALEVAKGGDVIELAPGQYGDFRLSNLQFESEVVIRSANPDDLAVFNTIAASNLSNVSFESLFFDFTPDAETLEWHSALRIENSADIFVRDSVFEGGVSVAGIPADSEAGMQGREGIMGEPIAYAMKFVDSDNVVIEDNDISIFKRGIVLGGGEGIVIRGNDIHDLRSSPLTGSIDGNLLVENNYFHDFHPWNFSAEGDHGDYVHIWTTPDHDAPISDITIKNNVFVEGEGESLLGIYLDDNSNDMGFTNVNIDGNVIHLGDTQAMRLEDVNGGRISNNTLLQSSGDQLDAPGIGLHDSENIVVTNNIMSRDIYGSSMEDPTANKIAASGNLVIQYTDPDGPNYFGEIFGHSTQPNAVLANVQALPGSVAEGIGSPLTQPITNPNNLQSSFKIYATDNGKSQTLVFDASHTYGPSGKVYPQDAEFLWDFGDGTQAKGISGSHKYSQPGEYNVVLKVSLNDTAASTSAQSTIGISGQDVLTFNTKTGLFTAQEFGKSSDLNGSDASSAFDGSQHIIELGGDGTRLELHKSKLENFFGSTDFQLSMTLKADKPDVSWGEVVRIHGSLVVSVKEDGSLNVQVTDETGQKIKLDTGHIAVNDGKAHDISLRLNEGTLTLQVDGLDVMTHEMLNALPDMKSWGLDFGNPWGWQNFDGILTAFDLDAISTDFAQYSGELHEFYDFTNKTEDEDHATSDDQITSPGDVASEEAPKDAPLEEEGKTPEDEAMLPALEDYVFDTAVLGDKQIFGEAKLLNSGETGYVQLNGGKDHIRLGRLSEFEESDEISFSVTFAKANASDGGMRLVWNHMHVGLQVNENGLRVWIGQKNEAFHKTIKIENLGIDDTEQHEVRVIINDQTDQLQVILDNEIVHYEIGQKDFEINDGADGRQWGWTLGSAWNGDFVGEIHDFRIEAEAEFVPLHDDGFSMA